MRISFIIPAHNEAAFLPATLAALRRAAEAAAALHEIIVVDDASTDATAEIARAGGARVVRVERRQISAVRNAGAAAATGDVFIFVDADTIVSARAVAEATRAIGRGAGFGGAPVRFDKPIPLWARAALPPFLVLYRAARLAPGCFFVARRDLFERVGGFDETVYASEEVLLANALRRAGGRYYCGWTPVLTSGRKLRDFSGRYIFMACVRILAQGQRGVQKREGLELWYEQRRDTSDGQP